MNTATENLPLSASPAMDSTAARLPTTASERIYKSYFSFMWSGTAFSAATMTYLIGGALPFVGNTVAGCIGYLCGLVLAMVPVVLAGMPSYRYGIDTLDAVKTSLGVRGSSFMLIGVLGSSLGWTFVLAAFSARGFGSVAQAVGGNGFINEHYVQGFGVVMLILVWALARRGAAGMARVTAWVAPGQLLSAAILLGLLVHKYGLHTVLHANVPAAKAYTQDGRQGLAYALEFGVANVLTFLPFIGGLTRLVSSRKHVMGPMVTGAGVVGAGFVAVVASFAAVVTGTADPTVWVIEIGGKWFGSALLLFMLLANVGTMVVFMYIGTVASTQIRIFASVRWSWLIAALLMPGVYLAFRTQWLLERVMVFMTYNGLFFVGVTGVILADYFVLRRQRIAPAQVFSKSKNGDYWFWGGVNWVAIACSILGACAYLWMFDPVSLKTSGIFRFFGAGLPACAATAAVYALLMRIFVVRGAKGGYPEARAGKKTVVEIGL